MLNIATLPNAKTLMFRQMNDLVRHNYYATPDNCDVLISFEYTSIPATNAKYKIFLSAEPKCIIHGYSSLSHFTHIVSFRDDIGNRIKSMSPLPWHIGWTNHSSQYCGFNDIKNIGDFNKINK